MQQTWRWFGPEDPVSLSDIRQAGATGIVTALHDIENGQVWPLENIAERKKRIEEAGLVWSVVESIPVHEKIKQGGEKSEEYTANWATSLRNLAACGVRTICYNFMPALDWTRTDLTHELPSGARCLKFDQDKFAAFDLYILKRENAEQDYTRNEMMRARQCFENMSPSERDILTQNIIAGLPGSEESYNLQQFSRHLSQYKNIDDKQLRKNLEMFLSQVLPIAEEENVRLAIHPDDPPRSLFGLPRIVSTIEDMRTLREFSNSKSNGFTLCTGSYGVREDNDILSMINEFGEDIHFLHLRSTKRDGNSFFEADHFGGDIDMVSILKGICKLEEKTGRSIPFRPDHGHQIQDDLTRTSNPGYPSIGRLKGLAELRGALLALKAKLE